MSDHVCTCDNCTAIALPAERQGPGHLSYRWIDADFTQAVAYLDGERVELCAEACPGLEGFVVTYKTDLVQDTHLCATCMPFDRAVTLEQRDSKPCRVLKRGVVRVVVGARVYE